MASGAVFEPQYNSSYANEQVDGKGFLAGLLKTAAGFEDYTYKSLVVTFLGGKQVEKSGNFFFKKPNLVRVEDDSGSGALGSLVVRQADGRIRGSAGPGLRFLKMTLSKDSHFLQLPNGYNVIDSDLTSLLRTIDREVNSGSTIKVTKTPVPARKTGELAYVVDVTAGSGESARLTDRIIVNPQTNVPTEWDVFRGGSLLSITYFGNFRANVGLADSLFKL